MDRWRFEAIRHEGLKFTFPAGSELVDRFVNALPLERGLRVIDVGCGNGEALLRIVERHGVMGVGVEESPYVVEEAEQRAQSRGLSGSVRFECGDGIAYRADEPSELAMCLGATWIWGGYRRTLAGLAALIKPGGLIAVGEQYEVEPAAAAHFPGAAARAFLSDAGNRALGADAGLTLLEVFDAGPIGVEEYHAAQDAAIGRFLAATPDDPDTEELAMARTEARSHTTRNAGNLGWAIYLFRDVTVLVG